jgi:2-polyprenyl-3-methyl-5-hydroxy-6-metoxy-1,4-benzoquinol methylase
MNGGAGPIGCPCDGAYLAPVFSYDEPPAGEVKFQATAAGYRREFHRCTACGHFAGIHAMDLGALYAGDYVTSTYGAAGIRAAFDRINALDAAHSDNAGRVARVLAFAASHWPGRSQPPAVLDVGSGLCVFLHRIKAAGWTATALDPDRRAVAHARDVVGVAALHGDFREIAVSGAFDAIAFNKVLEHVPQPVPMLARAGAWLAPGGFVYVEVPDGEAAAGDGAGREEFFIDHWHAFSPASLAMLADRAGFRAAAIERLREPSGKFTLRAFLIRS